MKGRQINFPRIGTHDLFMRTEYERATNLPFANFLFCSLTKKWGQCLKPRIKTLKKYATLLPRILLWKLDYFDIEPKAQIEMRIVPCVSCPLVPNPSSKSWPTEGFGLPNIFILLQCFLSIDDELWLQWSVKRSAWEKGASVSFTLRVEM